MQSRKIPKKESEVHDVHGARNKIINLTVMGRNTATRSTSGKIYFAFLALITIRILISHDFDLLLANYDLTAIESSTPTTSTTTTNSSSSTNTTNSSAGLPLRQDQQLQDLEYYYQEKETPKNAAPIWSAYTRQHHRNTSELDVLLQWRKPGTRKKIDTRRFAMEILTYGLSGAFPWYGEILPALRFDLPYHPLSNVEIAVVEGIVDATLDLHQCSVGKDEETDPDGYYDACFPPNHTSGRSPGRKACFAKGGDRSAEFRIHNYPSPGHERWSCQDKSVMEQLVAAQILDYLLAHGDRFFRSLTNNLFFSWEEHPVKFVSIDHSGSIDSFYRNYKYAHWVKLKFLLEHDMPMQLRKEIKRMVLLGSKEEFGSRVNSTIHGQLDNMNNVFLDLYHQENPDKKQPGFITDVIWDRLEAIVEYYNITIEE